jgi:hypothetical protein
LPFEKNTEIEKRRRRLIHFSSSFRLRYDNAMKPPPDNPEFARFTEAMRGIMKVSKTEINKRIEIKKKRKPKASASRVPGASHAS